MKTFLAFQILVCTEVWRFADYELKFSFQVFKTVKLPIKCILHMSLETQSSHQNILYSKAYFAFVVRIGNDFFWPMRFAEFYTTWKDLTLKNLTLDLITE